VGNEFVLPPSRLHIAVASPAVALEAPVALPEAPATSQFKKNWARAVDWLHDYSLGTFALLCLLVGSSAIQVAAAYQSAHITLQTTTASTAVHIPAQPLHGPNTVVLANQLADTLQRISAQPITLSLEAKTTAIDAETIKSWLQTVVDHKQGVAYIHVNEAAIKKTLSDTAAPYIKAPLNQVTLARADGTTQVIATGKNGTQLGDITAVSKQIGSSLLAAKGLQVNLPLETQAFAAVPASSIDKLIEVNVASKQMWLYDKGQLTHSYPISAGAPATPTPIGQFKIYSKLASQDMKGTYPVPYFQPHVHWINYFLPGGYAVHGVYWHGASWFGNINSSHGCVGLPDAQAKEVYDWAPIGTTVITHY
jgi:lipoprotein-anchoring transpeptidase ErfK/SrfK